MAWEAAANGSFYVQMCRFVRMAVVLLSFLRDCCYEEQSGVQDVSGPCQVRCSRSYLNFQSLRSSPAFLVTASILVIHTMTYSVIQKRLCQSSLLPTATFRAL